MDHSGYLRADGLSASDAKLLLSAPAKYRWAKDHPDDCPFGEPALEFGTLAHRLLLQDGFGVTVIDADDWRTKSAREEREQARREGLLPVLGADYAKASAMARAVRDHPRAGPILRVAEAVEQSWFATDPDTGVLLRGRPDLVSSTYLEEADRLLIVDYKTSASANPKDFARTSANLLYHLQVAWYLDLATLVGFSDEPAFLFIVQEKTPPYLVSVCEFDAIAVEVGRDLKRKAIDLYADCVANNRWPGYGDDTTVDLLTLPAWAR